ncbi:hypothetical protein J437_LFUL016229 [Ladona fulva]|uniref:Beta-1,4-glucuronyltransferase 1 n=1 Tax=Ladona fulva TaxID=123851 RepID=A0A8K0P8G8_LADFU|nr:hypothetical protein J437_LFUL016229 [Ladona fulva]
MGCRLWNLSMLSVLILTFSNILLTIRLLHSSDCPRPSLPGPPPKDSDVQSPDSEGVAKDRANEAQHHAQQVPSETTLSHASSKPSSKTNFSSSTAQTVSTLATTNINSHIVTTQFHMDLNLGRWDNRRLYKYFDFAVVGDQFANLSSRFSVCLATQSSLERLHTLAQVAYQWTGPISAAVFAPSDEFPLTRAFIKFLRRCYPPVRERVSFHFSFPAERPPTKRRRLGVGTDVEDVPWDESDDDDRGLPKLDCRNPEAALEELLRLRRPETIRWRMKYAYPQNHMRNLARKACQSQYVFLIDVDIIPSTDLAEKLDDFLVARPGVNGGPAHQGAASACRGLCAFVIPTYELDERVRFPKNKTDLVRLANKGLARPFHQKVFIFNQFATNFSRLSLYPRTTLIDLCTSQLCYSMQGVAKPCYSTPLLNPIEVQTNRKFADRWQLEPESPGGYVHVSHNVTNFEFLYEPFYVATDNVPPHDERFMGYGYTRNTQIVKYY